MKQKLNEILNQAVQDIEKHRKEIIEKLLEFATTDVLFFWGEKKELYLRQEKEWRPVLDWAESLLKVKLETTCTLNTPKNEEMLAPLAAILMEMSNKELACYYLAALNMRSVFLALALVKGKIDAKGACHLSYLEEVWQNEMWGSDEDAVGRRQERYDELKEIEAFLKEQK